MPLKIEETGCMKGSNPQFNSWLSPTHRVLWRREHCFYSDRNQPMKVDFGIDIGNKTDVHDRKKGEKSKTISKMSTIVLLDFVTILTMWYCLFFILMPR